jgi:putative FmdB family regulatory protein
MPVYSYRCQKCKKDFELFFYIKDYTENPECSFCGSRLTTRKYIEDAATLISSVKKADSELKTIGDLANRNRDKMSEDEKNSLYTKHNSYKYEESQKELPKGMTRIKPSQKRDKPKWT